MKKWNTPIIKELNLSNTELGQARTQNPDYEFKDQYDKIFMSFSGTGENTDNLEDRVPHQG